MIQAVGGARVCKVGGQSRMLQVVIKLRETIAESRVQTREKFACVRFALRVLANMIILLMLGFSVRLTVANTRGNTRATFRSTA